MAINRPSAPLIMGVLTGLLAAVTVLPTAVALYVYYSDAERVFAERQSAAAAGASHRRARKARRFGAHPPPGSRQLLKVDSIYAQYQDGFIFLQRASMHPDAPRTGV